MYALRQHKQISQDLLSTPGTLGNFTPYKKRENQCTSFRWTSSLLVYKVLWGRYCVVFISANPDLAWCLAQRGHSTKPNAQSCWWQERSYFTSCFNQDWFKIGVGVAEHSQGTDNSILPYRNLGGRDEMRWELTVFGELSSCWKNIQLLKMTKLKDCTDFNVQILICLLKKKKTCLIATIITHAPFSL